MDGRRAGEQDLADLIVSNLWDAVEDDALLDAIPETEMLAWEQTVRDMLEAHRINRYYDADGEIRGQET